MKLPFLACDIFDDSIEFSKKALHIFKYQSIQNKVYKEFIKNLNIDAKQIKSIDEIPYLPISFWKSRLIKSLPSSVLKKDFEQLFLSSGTISEKRSKHYIYDLSLYQKSVLLGFEYFFGNPKDYHILALLPSYQEQGDSSLIYMVNILSNTSNNEKKTFYLNENKLLYDRLVELSKKEHKTLLLGVSFALLDFIDNYSLNFPELLVMETGGMKGRKKEIIKEELHYRLKKGFGVERIYSEYGMTECLSQAYSIKDGKYKCPPWMIVNISDITNPLSIVKDTGIGVIQIIDLSNIYSCSFIKTDDIGKKNNNGSFEILGRLDHSQLRGCSLLV